MQIISGRQFLFEKETYHNNEKTDEIVRKVEASITVRAIPQAQIVPDWVAETELFKVAVEDGTIIEVQIQGAAPNFKIDNNSKAGINGPQQEFAKIATDNDSKEQKAPNGLQQSKAAAGGWGAPKQ